MLEREGDWVNTGPESSECEICEGKEATFFSPSIRIPARSWQLRGNEDDVVEAVLDHDNIGQHEYRKGRCGYRRGSAGRRLSKTTVTVRCLTKKSAVACRRTARFSVSYLEAQMPARPTHDVL